MQSSNNPLSIYALFKLSWSQYECAPESLTDLQKKEVANRISNQLGIEYAVLNSDQNQGVVISERMVNQSIDEITSRYDSYISFEQALEAADLNLNLLKEGVRHDLQVEAVLDRVSAECEEVTNAEVELFYYMHPERFQVKERRTAHHILITINEDFEENQHQSVIARINEIRERICKKKSRFHEQAQKHSECPTALHGGKIGHVEQGQLYPEIDSVLFDMELGEISKPILSPMGYHLIYCDEIEEPRTVPLTEVLPKLKASLTDRQRSIHQRKWINEQLNLQAGMPQLVNS
ncbi:MAG: nitrogen fixation protein NifM [Neptuniibacter sp.]